MLGLIEKEISQGNELSEVMAKSPRLFREPAIMWVRVGEQTGQLAEIFKSLGDGYDCRYFCIVSKVFAVKRDSAPDY